MRKKVSKKKTCARGKVINPKTNRCILKRNTYVKRKAPLTKIEIKYCRCLAKVRSKKIPNPYGICTRSVYNLQGKKRTKQVECSKNYIFDDFTLKQLRDYAREKRMHISRKGRYFTRAQLLTKIKNKLKNKI